MTPGRSAAMEKTQWHAVQRAEFDVRFGRNAGLRTSTEVTSGGLVAIAVLVSAILLSTAVLVQVAVRESKRPSGLPVE